jgi:hypothetical protein
MKALVESSIFKAVERLSLYLISCQAPPLNSRVVEKSKEA